MAETGRAEAIVFSGDAAARGRVRAFLEAEGVPAIEAASVPALRDALQATKARTVLVRAREDIGPFAELRAELARKRPDVDVLVVPEGLGHALLDGAVGRRTTAAFARDALWLLTELAELATDSPASSDRISKWAELTAARLGLSRLRAEAVAAAAALAAMGPLLARFRFGAPAPAVAEAGLSKELAVSVAAARTLSSPYPLDELLGAAEERWDGRGRPRGLGGEAIPIGSRVLAVARGYTRALVETDPASAVQVLGTRAGSEYDPRVVDAFVRVLRDAEYVARMESSRGGLRIAVVDGDTAALAIAELRLSSAGFGVDAYQDGRAAQEGIVASPPAAVVSELALPRFDGLSLLLKLRRTPPLDAVPFFVVTGSPDQATAAKALKLGARDVIAKPVSFDLLIAKLRAATSGAAAPATERVQGSISELPLPDLLQVVGFGRRSVAVRVEPAKGAGGWIVLERGEPLAASLDGGAKGVPAFLELVGVAEGRFRLEAAPLDAERNLTGSLEALLLEAMHKADEGRREPTR